jgi:hypothetical protein
VEELVKVYFATVILINVLDHLIDGLIFSFKAKGLHCSAEFFRVNGAAAIGVKEIESYGSLGKDARDFSSET